MQQKRFEGVFSFYTKNTAGNFETEPHIYCKTGDSEDEVKQYTDLIFQAIEIEGLDNTEVYVIAEFTMDGEYLDRDEFIIRTDVVRTTEPSQFFVWGDKEPHIFAVDKKNSKIEFYPE